ncbi:Hypothetical protein KVN_LOCUS37 [uncultured virus]|nr:Hypothetical protein KVN_LOCUS37 [uncultured virus]
MGVNGLYFGKGFNLTISDLKNIYFFGSDENYEFCDYYDICEKITKIIKQILPEYQIISYPHTYKEYKEKKFAIGKFVHVGEFNTQNIKINMINNLKNLINEYDDFGNLEKLLGKKIEFMSILDDCRCCS